MNNPIALFQKWFDAESTVSTSSVPSAVCLSTIGTDGFPNARFVSLKEIRDDFFVVTGPLQSRKGVEIATDNKVALTFWWAGTERQVRIQGEASKISEVLADSYFEARNEHSKAVSVVSKQGEVTDNLAVLERKMLDKVAEKEPITRPKDWGGFAIKPLRIEFMEFKETRFHDRKCFLLENGKWQMLQLQP
ncbi:MAG: pyridoxal 5'-phosphate synthase [Bacteroidota bacterium]